MTDFAEWKQGRNAARCVGRIVLIVAGLCPVLSGCASPGFPRAPSLHLPAPVIDLTATRVGDRVELRWTAPVRSTDGLDLTSPGVVEVCRDAASDVAPSGSAAQPCTAVLKLPGHTGASSAVDNLPPSVVGPQAARGLIAYRVRVLNPSGRAALPTMVALVPGGLPLEPVADFHVVQEKGGVLLEWREASPAPRLPRLPVDAVVEVLRTDLRLNLPVPAPAVSPKPTNPMARPQRAAPTSELRLRAEAGDGLNLHPSLAGTEGMIDRSALPDGTYRYRARRVLTASSGGRSLEMFSESTSPVTVAMRDTFPPAIPLGLASIPGTTGSPASLKPTIDLSWQPNAEADLAGYHVYRTEVAAGARAEQGRGVRLTDSPVPGPAFRDSTVRPGHRYAYRVTSIDRNGNESSPSAAVLDSPEGR